MKKQWYEIKLTHEDGFKETVVKVKSKGLAYIVLQQIKITYANTDFKVIIV